MADNIREVCGTLDAQNIDSGIINIGTGRGELHPPPGTIARRYSIGDPLRQRAGRRNRGDELLTMQQYGQTSYWYSRTSEVGVMPLGALGSRSQSGQAAPSLCCGSRGGVGGGGCTVAEGGRTLLARTSWGLASAWAEAANGKAFAWCRA